MSGARGGHGIALAVCVGTIVQPRSVLPQGRDPTMAGDSLTLSSSAVPLTVSGEPEPPPQPEWLRYLAAVRRHAWLVLAVTLAVTGLGVVGAMLMPPSYVTQAIVWIRVPAKELHNEGPIWQGQLPISSGWMELLQSYAVLDYAVRSRRLYLHPALPGDSDVLGTLGIKEQVVPGEYRLVVDDSGARFTLFAARDPVARGLVGDSVGPDLGLAWVPPAAALARGREVKFTLDAPYEAALKLADQLKVSADLDGNFLRMQLGGRDPVGVAATVNAVAERFVTVAAGLKRDNLGQLTSILGAQLEQGQAALRRAEDALRAFRVGAVTTLAEGAGSVTQNTQYQRDPLFAGLVEMKVSLDELRRDREAIERLLRQGLDSGVSVDALAMVGAVQRSTELVQALRDLTAKQAELRALRGHYTDDNPPVRRAVAEADALGRRTIPALASSLAAELRARETQLGQRVATASTGLKQVPPLAVEEARLQRDVTIAEQLFTTVQQSYNQTQLAAVSTLPDVRILDRSTAPDRPDRNWTPLFASASFVVSLGLAVFGVVLLDGVDHKVRYPEHVTHQMRLSILGAVPRFDWRHLGNGKSAEAAAPVVEALRGLRLRLSHAGGSGPLLVTVTSPGVGEGKSFLSCNLALAFADAGYRTLLIDGDVRRGGQHRMLGLHREPGLIDFLAGELPFETVVQATRHPGLSFIGCGARRPSAPELLSSDVMSDLIDRVRAEYGVVLVDSPPLAVGVDPYVLATRTGNVLIVLRAGVSDLDLAAAKLDVLDTLPVRVLGAVLNDVRPYGAYRYYTYDAAAYTDAKGVAGQRRSGSAGVLWGRS